MMQFTLAGLMRLRRLREESTAHDVSRARSRASELAAERHQLIETLYDRTHEARDVRGISAISAARASSAGMLTELAALAADQDRVVRAAEEAHRDALRDLRTVEKLEERHDERVRHEALRAEQAVLDEFASRPGARPGPEMETP